MTARRIRADELVELSGVLAGGGNARGRPRTAHLRRAISTAYYAAFHEVVDKAVLVVIGDAPEDERQRDAVSRWVAHNDLVALNKAVNPTGPTPALAAAIPHPHVDVKAVAEGLVTLQDLRLRADYDHAFDVNKRQALSAVTLARDVLARSARLTQNRDRSYQVFLSLMIGAVQAAKKRS